MSKFGPGGSGIEKFFVASSSFSAIYPSLRDHVASSLLQLGAGHSCERLPAYQLDSHALRSYYITSVSWGQHSSAHSVHVEVEWYSRRD